MNQHLHVCLQFTLRDLLRFMTICSILCALIPLTGPWRALLLAMVTLAVALRQGGVALTLIGIAVLAVPHRPEEFGLGHFATMATALALGWWFTWARRRENIQLSSPFAVIDSSHITRPMSNPFAEEICWLEGDTPPLANQPTGHPGGLRPV